MRPFGLPSKRQNCSLCGTNPSLLCLADSKRWAQNEGINSNGRAGWSRFGAISSCSRILLPTKNKATVLDLMDALSSSEACVLLDVRNSNQFSMCRLPRAFSLPLRGIIEQPDSAAVKIRGVMSSQNSVLFVLCRRGIDSRFATHLLLKLGFQNARDVTGGLDAWRRDVDPTFPIY